MNSLVRKETCVKKSNNLRMGRERREDGRVMQGRGMQVGREVEKDHWEDMQAEIYHSHT